MSNGNKFDYSFPRKDSWRGWVWNRVVQKLSRAAKDAICVYLPGAEDLDKDVALRKGFQAENMIAVERSPHSVELLRKHGVLTIKGEFNAVINYLAIHESLPRIDAVLGDFCGGPLFELPTLNVGWVHSGCFASCMFAFNFLRGRDPLWIQSQKMQLGLRRADSLPCDMPVHRGFQYMLSFTEHLRRACVMSDDKFAFMAKSMKPEFLIVSKHCGEYGV